MKPKQHRMIRRGKVAIRKIGKIVKAAATTTFQKTQKVVRKANKALRRRYGRILAPELRNKWATLPRHVSNEGNRISYEMNADDYLMRIIYPRPTKDGVFVRVFTWNKKGQMVDIQSFRETPLGRKHEVIQFIPHGRLVGTKRTIANTPRRRK
jgi:hypothetical protein